MQINAMYLITILLIHFFQVQNIGIVQLYGGLGFFVEVLGLAFVIAVNIADINVHIDHF